MDIWQMVLTVCAGIAAIGAALTYIAKVIKPARDVKKRLDGQDVKLDNDNRRLKAGEDCNRAICKALLALLDHAITGNGIASIKEARDALNKYLIER